MLGDATVRELSDQAWVRVLDRDPVAALRCRGQVADPLDRYGRLSSERFHAARLVVDTGLNVLGWSRERAAAYLRVNGFLSDVEIGTELLRYAVDDPGQALAYHLGHWYLRELRGARDARQFHEAVLAEGPLPLSLLGHHLADQPPQARGAVGGSHEVTR